MHKEQFILKERLKALIAERKVKAALFYTFNFDPKFFENYVMPLLVPDQQFINNNIANNILWRRLYKDDKVPPVTVYCDLYAKSIDNGPMLDYKVISVNMPSVGKNKGNFHPKHSFVLIENEGGEDSLIIISGSNNLTQGGWCENIECISEHVLTNKKHFPENFKKEMRNFIENILTYAKNLTAAEDLIIAYLNKQGHTRDQHFQFYNSFQNSFRNFLDENVFFDPGIKEVEIFSPFFCKNASLIEHFKEKGLTIKIEAPFKNNYCLLEEAVYKTYKKAGVKWYRQGDESRNTHSKVYRFYGADKTYTIVGSVNLTTPAWAGVPEKIVSIYNIESAILYIDHYEKKQPLLKNEIKDEQLRFINAELSLENTFEERVNAPDIEFTINWSAKTLKWKAALKTTCILYITEDVQIVLNETKELLLSELKHAKQILNALARQTVLKVIEKVNETCLIHYYYPNQEGFDQKPLEYRLSATDIIDIWELLGKEDQELNAWLVSRLEVFTDIAQDESGRIIEKISESKNLLNEMARHLYGLVKLEQFLFNDSIWNKANYQKQAHYNELRYYLTNENVDTLKSYLKDIEKLYHDNHLLGGYYWILLSVIHTNIYEAKWLQRMIRDFGADDKDKKSFRALIQDISMEIIEKIQAVENVINIDRKKLMWAKNTLLSNYELA
jgi:HKD family nuclease